MNTFDFFFGELEEHLESTGWNDFETAIYKISTK